MSNLSRDSLWPIGWGLLAAGLGPLVGGSVYELARGTFFDDGPGAVLGMGLIAYPFAVVAAGLLGLPVFLLARRFRLERWWMALAAGIAGGAALALLLALPGAPRLQTLLTFIVQGTASALLFYITWRVTHARHVTRSAIHALMRDGPH